MMPERSLPGFFMPPAMAAEKSVYEQALTLLEYRARSVDELRRKLRQKGGAADEIEEALQRLLDQKLLDDADYAKQFARGKLGSSGASRRRIAQELGRKGIGRDAADAAIEELTGEEGLDPLQAAQRIARKKWTALASLDEPTRRRRLYAFLARRGFNPDEIRELMAGLGEDLVQG